MTPPTDDRFSAVIDLAAPLRASGLADLVGSEVLYGRAEHPLATVLEVWVPPNDPLAFLATRPIALLRAHVDDRLWSMVFKASIFLFYGPWTVAGPLAIEPEWSHARPLLRFTHRTGSPGTHRAALRSAALGVDLPEGYRMAESLRPPPPWLAPARILEF